MAKKIDLTELTKREMEKAKGGTECEVWVSQGGGCWCACAGPSSTHDNGEANWQGGLHTDECFVGCNPQM